MEQSQLVPSTFNEIPYRRNNYVSKGSLGQIMRSLQDHANKTPKTNSQEILYAGMKDLVNESLTMFLQFFVFESQKQRDVFWFNLCGYGHGEISGQIQIEGFEDSQYH